MWGNLDLFASGQLFVQLGACGKRVKGLTMTMALICVLFVILVTVVGFAKVTTPSQPGDIYLGLGLVAATVRCGIHSCPGHGGDAWVV